MTASAQPRGITVPRGLESLHARSTTVDRRAAGYRFDMKLMRTAAMAGVAKKVYDEARKPHNQQKIRDAVASVKARRSGSTKRP